MNVRDRGVRRIRLVIPFANLQKLVMVVVKEYGILEYLINGGFARA